MFAITKSGVRFKPEFATKDGNPKLVKNIGVALRVVLNEHAETDPEAEAQVAELVSAHGQAFEARLSLWGAMLDSARQRRSFTDAELRYYEQQIDEAENVRASLLDNTEVDAAIRAQAISDRKTLDTYGLLFDDQITQTVDRMVANVMEGKPTLPVGDKGIAKTQAAYFTARLWEPEAEPVIISGHGDMMSNELIGQLEQDEVTKVFTFKPGKLIQAMRDGRPAILDEVNIGDQQIIMRLQHILLLRPGDKVVLQENGGEEIEVQPGFAILATANEASARYVQRNVLDPAFRDRFDVLQQTYPDMDSENPVKQVPSSLMRLAFALGTDESGRLSRHLDAAELEKMVRLAHVTQHLYSVPARDARVNLGDLGDGTATNRFIDDEEPVMTDCITPRALADIVKRCAAGNKPNITLEHELQRVVRGLDQSGSTRNQDYANEILKLLKRRR
ncbi:MAG TPA: AAA family ATPase [Candidatus Saccharimonadales bacterium]|nr:AAA family ATPase [Candidatus Saccharimonadales bacterium]